MGSLNVKMNLRKYKEHNSIFKNPCQQRQVEIFSNFMLNKIEVLRFFLKHIGTAPVVTIASVDFRIRKTDFRSGNLTSLNNSRT